MNEEGCQVVEQDIAMDASLLPPELLQVLGNHLSSSDLRNARLCCKPWATALAHCMPTVTMSLPKQTSERVFRQPLVLGSTNDSRTRSAHYFSAMPRGPPSRNAAASAAAKPNPFATRGGQAAVGDVACGQDQGFAAAAAAATGGFINITASLPPGILPRSVEPGSSCAGSWSSSSSSCSMSGWGEEPGGCCSSVRQAWSGAAAPSPQQPDDQLVQPASLWPAHMQLSAAAEPDDERRTPLPLGPAGPGQPAPADSPLLQTGRPNPLSAAPAASAAAGPPAILFGSGCLSSRPTSHSLGWEMEPLIACMSDVANAAVAHLPQHGRGSTVTSSTMAAAQGSLSSGASDGSSDGSSYATAGDADGSSVDGSALLPPEKGVCCLLLPESPAAHSSSKSEASASSNWGSDNEGADDTQHELDQQQSNSSNWVGAAVGAGAEDAARQLSVITSEHVEALRSLPCLSSLELRPKDGVWDAAASAALQELSKLTGLRKLSITWGDAAAAEPLTESAAISQAHGAQLPLQRCLAGLTQLQELELRGRPVVDVLLLQRMQQLRILRGEALHVVNSDVLPRIQQQSMPVQQQQQLQQQQHAGIATAAAAAAAAAAAGLLGHGDAAAVVGHGVADAVPGAAADQQQPVRRTPKWAVLPALEELDVVHAASDISCFLQGTQTPNLHRMGFVSCSPSDFARLLGQHGKLQQLHLTFRGEEPWHPIAVVRLPTALPSLRSLSLIGSFWLPNSLIVGLGVMEVPLQELHLACKMAPACLQRLQHLSQLRKLALHHVPWTGHVAEGVLSKDMMLQLPAALLPPQLAELEISNGWIQQ